MKVFNFILIALGIMVFLWLGGVQTNSGAVVNAIFFNNVSKLNVSTDSSTDIDIDKSVDFSTGFFNVAFIVLLALGLTGAVSKISVGQFQIQPNLDGVYAFCSSGLWLLFAGDMINVLKLVYGIKDGIGWEFFTISILIFVFLVGFMISLMEFVRGTD